MTSSSPLDCALNSREEGLSDRMHHSYVLPISGRSTPLGWKLV